MTTRMGYRTGWPALEQRWSARVIRIKQAAWVQADQRLGDDGRIAKLLRTGRPGALPTERVEATATQAIRIRRLLPHDHGRTLQRRSRSSSRHRRRRRIPWDRTGGQDDDAVVCRCALRSGSTWREQVARRASQQDVERLLFRHVDQLNRQCGADHVSAVDDRRAAQARPFRENYARRCISRIQGDLTGVELKLDRLLCFER